ncbi:hypothetical protein [Streptomyces acidiscabies]|uniref:hypothetical protein n=1 Tax=Streptomyces acidiscabies TaxID=42234 RepID=UPI000953338F|nr:hypothetical protein [Streptomyces acidiscabies]
MTAPVCTHWGGPERRHCRAAVGVRAYLTGPRCPAHTPSALAGRPEPEPGPGLPATAWSTPSPLSDSRIADQRAISSGKRRSNPTAYKAAQAAVRKETA